MKRISRTAGSVAALLISGAASAQTVTVNPVEAGGVPDAAGFFSSIPPSAGNQANLIQRSSGNQARVDQAGGTEGVALVVQGNSAADSGANDAQIDQRGSGTNEAMIQQASTNTSNGIAAEGELPLPAGRDTPDRTARGGFRQQAKIYQTSTGGDANSAVILQGVSGVRGFQNEAGILQNGSGNDAAIQQGGGTNQQDGRMFSLVDQEGDGNVAENIQGEADYSYVNQRGDGNEAYVDQSYERLPFRRSSDVGQEGNGNVASVVQRARETDSSVLQGLRSAGSEDNKARVDQKIGSIRATSVIMQDGKLNEATNTQSGVRAKAFVDQIGERNVSEVRQAALSIATVNQFGDDGISEVVQTAAGNTATVTQAVGSAFADSFIEQSGAGNLAEVTQGNDANASDILQAGSLNQAFVFQTVGSNNGSTISQTGSRAIATVHQ